MFGSDAIRWFDTTGFMPHGHCYLWTPPLLFAHVGSDAVIGTAYLAIPFLLLRLTRRRPDLPFRPLFASFGLFIALCGLTHWMSIWNVWHAEYWIEGLIRIATALASLPAAISLWNALPSILALPSTAQLAASNRELAASNRELEAFVATASHDLRSPLQGVRFLLEALLRSARSALDDRDRGLVDNAVAELNRMSLAVDARLQLAKLARDPVERVAIDVSALAAKITGRLALTTPTRAVEVAIDDGLTVYGDAVMLEILFDAVLDNAWKFTAEASEPRIEVRRGQAPGSILIRDNGAGFDMQEAPRLFQPLQRLHPAERFPGHGIGLAAVARIIERHAGEISLDSRPGVGTTVTVVLPMRVRARRPPALAASFATLAI